MSVYHVNIILRIINLVVEFYTWYKTLGFDSVSKDCSRCTSYFIASFIDCSREQTFHFQYSSRVNWELCCCFNRTFPFCLQSRTAWCCWNYISLQKKSAVVTLI